ncbi:unnamed protein product [Symbiodinium natans]|uniref:Uncharacterized protein n=1 Tax=Symbiodinium natans TaxID=878477 RepID=A0A812SZ73_9DINO|nr:unnamed protein product [Symbiodinium natans]
MHLSKKRASELYRRGLFRATTGLEILSSGGRVWSDFGEADYVRFQESLQVKNVDVFISHSWAADRWEKHLAMCFFLNLSSAQKAAAAGAIFSQCLLLLLPEQSIDITYFIVLDLPVLLFFILFFFGQHLTCGSTTMWMDKMCIDQTSESTKSRGIAELPAIVANSDQFLVLWSESYFGRLWCNFELSIFVRLCDLGKIRCVPLWMAPWLLTTILFSWIGSRLDAMVLDSDPDAFTVVMSFDPTCESELAYAMRRIMQYVAEAPFFAITLLPTLIVSAVSFKTKLDRHEAMLRQMETFDIRGASCSVEQDRDVIETKVAELFDGIDDPVLAVDLDSALLGEVVEATSTTVPYETRPAIRSVTTYFGHEESLDAFNNFVRHPLRAEVTEDLGTETQLPWSICLLTFFPAFLDFAAQTWVGRPSRSKAGFTSDGQYFAMSFGTAFLAFLLNFPLSPPCFLQLLKCIVVRTNPGLWRGILALSAGFMLNMSLCTMYGLMTGMLESFVVTQHPALLAAFLFVLVVHFLLNLIVYRQELLSLPTWRLSCRGLCRSEYDGVS